MRRFGRTGFSICTCSTASPTPSTTLPHTTSPDAAAPTSWPTPAQPSAQAGPPGHVAGPPWPTMVRTIYQQLSPAEVHGRLDRVMEQLLEPFPRVPELLVGAVLAKQHDQWAEARPEGKSGGTEFAQPSLRKPVCAGTAAAGRIAKFAVLISRPRVAVFVSQGSRFASLENAIGTLRRRFSSFPPTSCEKETPGHC